jgi:hypothetical protein
MGLIFQYTKRTRAPDSVGARTSPATRLFAGHVLHALFVLRTDFIHQLRIEYDGLLERHRPRPGVGFRIVDGDLDLRVP